MPYHFAFSHWCGRIRNIFRSSIARKEPPPCEGAVFIYPTFWQIFPFFPMISAATMVITSSGSIYMPLYTAL